MLPALLLSVLPGPIGPAPSQAPAVGDRLPPIQVNWLAQTEARSFADYHGRAVLIEFFAHWCVPCARSVPHLNELQEKFGARGLSVVAVTSERPAETEQWIKKHGAKYAYGYDGKRKLQELFEIRGIPFAVLVDPFGTILWSGNPMRLSEERIESALDGALRTPAWTWPAEAREVLSALQRRDHAAALEAAELLSPSDAFDPVAAVRERIGAHLAHFEHEVAREEYLVALQFGERARVDLGELPEAARLAVRMQEVLDAPGVRRTLAGQEQLVKLERDGARATSAEELESVRARAAALAGEFPGTKIERRARTLVEEMDKSKAGAPKKKP